jgi:hypothetical protein
MNRVWRRRAALPTVVLGLVAASACGGESASGDDSSRMTPVAATRLPLQPSVPSLGGDPQPVLTDPREAGMTRDEVIFLSQECASQAEVTNTASECFRRTQQILERQWSCTDAPGCVRVARRVEPGVTRTGVDRNDAAVVQIIDPEECGNAPNGVCLQLPATAALLNAQKDGGPTGRGSDETVTTETTETTDEPGTTETTDEPGTTETTDEPATTETNATETATPEADAHQQASPGAGTAEREPSPS